MYHPEYFVTALLSIQPSLNPREDFTVVNDGTGPKISAWNRTDITQPTQAAIEAVDTDTLLAAQAVPQTVTPLQARLALLGAGLLDQVTAAVNAAGGATLITWNYAAQFDRNDPMILSLGAALNLTAAQIDALFVQAAKL
ncbi:hypothetical protein HU230_0012485 [Bradyrhizobium quebecense]|uniref:Bacteriophage SP-beta YorD domain-containing protein n=1 Tax=Bradyrhizobium quebecense TaxID=2748629 RepID=A0A973WMR4_9BRAD|nr:hypothetical protein [Bradyrhizobium quebecense]UGA46806.1 hypothetical protein HU230_0012485 [Bradyrhizobium quebecense]